MQEVLLTRRYKYKLPDGSLSCDRPRPVEASPVPPVAVPQEHLEESGPEARSADYREFMQRPSREWDGGELGNARVGGGSAKWAVLSGGA